MPAAARATAVGLGTEAACERSKVLEAGRKGREVRGKKGRANSLSVKEVGALLGGVDGMGEGRSVGR